MTRRPRKFPYVTPNRVAGKLYLRFRRAGYACNLPGPLGSEAFIAAYQAAMAASKAPAPPPRNDGTLGAVIATYFASMRYADASPARRRTIRRELEWLRAQAGDVALGTIKVEHVERLMARKAGPVAANTVRKKLSMLFNFAAAKMGYAGPNPARGADRRKTNGRGYHTWTEAEVARFLERHGPGTTARLALLLALNTGMSRADLAAAGWQLCTPDRTRIAYRRAKTGVEADLPIMPELAHELARLPRARMLFLTHGAPGRPYAAESLGNWFRDRAREADCPGSLHGLRKAGATRLAEAGATEWEVAAFLAHRDTSEARTYTRAADRAKLADSGLAKRGALSKTSVQTAERGKKNEA